MSIHHWSECQTLIDKRGGCERKQMDGTHCTPFAWQSFPLSQTLHPLLNANEKAQTKPLQPHVFGNLCFHFPMGQSISLPMKLSTSLFVNASVSLDDAVL